VIVALLLAQAATNPPPVIQLMMKPEDYTRPIYKYQCVVRNSVDQRADLSYTVYGSRGFRDEAGGVTSTKQTVVIDVDKQKLFTDRQFENRVEDRNGNPFELHAKGPKDFFNVEVRGANESGAYLFKDGGLAVVIIGRGATAYDRGLAQWVGFCNVIVQQQLPLSENMRKKLGK
jgi:hypothetical protein